MRTVAIDFACNDPDNGLFMARVGTAEIDGNEIERPAEVTFRETQKGFRIHRKQFEVDSRTEWLGNWCWNRYLMSVREANRLAAHLSANGWRCTTGEVRFKDWFNRTLQDRRP